MFTYTHRGVKRRLGRQDDVPRAFPARLPCVPGPGRRDEIIGIFRANEPFPPERFP